MKFTDYLKEQNGDYNSLEPEEYLALLETNIIDLIDMLEDTTPEQDDLIDEILDMIEGETSEVEDDLNEGKKRVKVVRGGKVQRKIKCTGKNMKVVNGKCVHMGASERRARAKAAKKAARKRRGKMSSINRKRKKSVKIGKRQITGRK